MCFSKVSNSIVSEALLILTHTIALSTILETVKELVSTEILSILSQTCVIVSHHPNYSLFLELLLKSALQHVPKLSQSIQQLSDVNVYQ